jgi:hypothetical protein
MKTLEVDRPVRRRLFGVGVAVAASVLLVGFAGSATAATPLPTPTQIAVSQLTSQSFSLNIGGSTPKLYSVFLNGRLAIGIAQSSSSISFPVRNLTQNTDYIVRVQEIALPSGRTSALSAPRVVHTPVYVAPALPAAVTSLRASGVTSDSATLSWSPSPTVGVTYRVYLNGELRQETTTGTSLLVGPVLGFPNPIPNSGLRPGQANRLGVEAVTAAGVASPVTEVTVTTPGTAATAPTAPTNLRVTSATNNRIDLSWTASVDSQIDPTQLQYRFYLDGRFAGYTCSQYCFGSTAGAIGNLAPGTTYRIGVEALGTGVSGITEITATTATP